jgi:hypothetical protein
MAREGFDGGHPAIARVLDGIRRRYGTKQDAKTAILTEDLRHIVRAPPASLTGGRNSAVAQIRDLPSDGGRGVVARELLSGRAVRRCGFPRD